MNKTMLENHLRKCFTDLHNCQVRVCKEVISTLFFFQETVLWYLLDLKHRLGEFQVL